MKKLKLALLTLVVALIGFGSFNTIAQAKTTWHKGMPKVLRGTWVSKDNSGPSLIGHGWTGMAESIITSKTYTSTWTHHRSDAGVQTNPYYHHKKGSQYYYVKARVKANFAHYTKELIYTRFGVKGNRLSERPYGYSEISKGYGWLHPDRNTGFQRYANDATNTTYYYK